MGTHTQHLSLVFKENPYQVLRNRTLFLRTKKEKRYDLIAYVLACSLALLKDKI
jgi:hypothetical protein